MIDQLGVNSQPVIKILEFRIFTNADQAIGEVARGDSESGLSKISTEKLRHVSLTVGKLPSINSEDLKREVSC